MGIGGCWKINTQASACECCRWCHPHPLVWRVTEALWRMEQRPLCGSCASLSWFCGLVSSQYLISMRWMSRWIMLRLFNQCCLEKVDLLVAAGGALEGLPGSFRCPLSLLKILPTSLLVCCFFVFGTCSVITPWFFNVSASFGCHVLSWVYQSETDSSLLWKHQDVFKGVERAWQLDIRFNLPV